MGKAAAKPAGDTPRPDRGNTENFRGFTEPMPMDHASAMRLRALALELAVKAAPLTMDGPKIKGAELLVQAEHIETWLKKAYP